MSEGKRLSIRVGDLLSRSELVRQLLSDDHQQIRGKAIWLLVEMGVRAFESQLAGAHVAMSDNAVSLTEILTANIVWDARSRGAEHSALGAVELATAPSSHHRQKAGPPPVRRVGTEPILSPDTGAFVASKQLEQVPTETSASEEGSSKKYLESFV